MQIVELDLYYVPELQQLPLLRTSSSSPTIMDQNLQPVLNVDPSDLPKGFTMTNPNGNTSGAGAGSGSAMASSSSQQQQADEESKQMILEQVLTLDAIARLNRIKLVKPDKVRMVTNAICAMASAGQIPGPITEGKLIEMLERRNRNTKSSTTTTTTNTSNGIHIERKRYAMDSDDDLDDNDDDL